MTTILVLIAGLRAGLAELNLIYPENPPLKHRKTKNQLVGFINILLCGFKLVYLAFEKL